MIEVRVPETILGGPDKTASVVVWLYADGAQVREGDTLAELLVEKVSFDVESPAGGVLRLHAEPETPLEQGALLATIE